LIVYILQALVVVAWLLVMGRILMSWVDPTYSRPLGQFLFTLTEPFLAPIRRVLPQTGMFDLSPLVLLLELSFLLRVIVAL
jgi:YggT family protein